MAQVEADNTITAWPDMLANYASHGQFKMYPWIQYISQQITPLLLQGNARILLEAPPQHGKSLFISSWVPPWYLKLFPNHRVILATYAQTYANKWGVAIRDNLKNPIIDVPLRDDMQTKQKVVTSAGGQVLCVGVGGPTTGESAELFIIDDPFKNYEEAMSPRIRERNLDWFKSVATTRLQPGASVIIMHTRWHEDDLIGELSREGHWTHIKLPAVAEPNDPMGREPGAALCPERFDEEALIIKRRDVGEMVWSALYQGHPVILGGNIVKGEWIKRYDVMPAQFDDVAIFADLTYTKDEESDYSVFELWGRIGVKIYLIDQIRAQMGISEQIAAFIRMVETYPEAFHKEIEKKANGAAVIELVENHIMGIVANNPQTEKTARLAAVAPLYYAGNVYYPSEQLAPWVKVNVDEITRFPKTKNDDTVDVASMAVRHFGKISEGLRALEALGKR